MTALLPKDAHGCPYLQLAPMEGVGDQSFRKAIAFLGGFDEAVRDFIRVPRCPHIESLASVYDPHEIAPIPLAAQLMGAEPHWMAEMAKKMEEKGAPRIDINCGCPSNMVTGKGAGSSLLKEPSFLQEVAEAVVKAVKIPVTIKMRSGYEDISLFRENLLAAEQSGVRYIVLHPRTKAEGYGPPARWDLIAEAKSVLRIPVVGNGDITTVQEALRMLQETSCDALMIGRGALMNPFLFLQIRAHYAGRAFLFSWEDLQRYFRLYHACLPSDMPKKFQINKLKQLFSFFCKGSASLLEKRKEILASDCEDPERFLCIAETKISEFFYKIQDLS